MKSTAHTDITYTEKCAGCRSCEIACSYHHQEIFSRKIASIEVKRWEKNGKFGIILYRQGQDEHLACDCAKGHEFCVNYCPAVAREELRNIIIGGFR